MAIFATGQKIDRVHQTTLKAAGRREKKTLILAQVWISLLNWICQWFHQASNSFIRINVIHVKLLLKVFQPIKRYFEAKHIVMDVANEQHNFQLLITY